MLRAVRGMRDILPAETIRWQWLEHTFRTTVERFGFGEVRTPLLEPTELFVREVGEDTDIVAKEMYSFERHGDALTVRPEGTAGATRAYVQNAVGGAEPVSRWYYLGPMFRAERPAKGRYRQFHQAGCEIYGDPGPVCDAEMIELCVQIVRALGVDSFQIHLNSIGSAATRARYREVLKGYFAPHRAALSEDSQRRLETNPLRILDSKAEQDREIALGAPNVAEVLAPEDAAHFDGVRRCLDALDLPYLVDPLLVRGLDYYTRTLFELKTTGGELGAQDALLGGGRYDDMVQSLGGKRPVPAIGFAMGIERVLAITTQELAAPAPACYFAPMADEAHGTALSIARQLRARGHYCEVDGRGGSLKAMLRRANALGARLAVLIGQDEVARGVVTLRDLRDHQQRELPLANAAADLLGALGGDGGALAGAHGGGACDP